MFVAWRQHGTIVLRQMHLIMIWCTSGQAYTNVSKINISLQMSNRNGKNSDMCSQISACNGFAVQIVFNRLRVDAWSVLQVMVRGVGQRVRDGLKIIGVLFLPRVEGFHDVTAVVGQ